MALDPRIALQGASWQAPDILGAMRQGQEYRQNQMAMQAAKTAAEAEANAMADARLVDPTNRASVNAFTTRHGPRAAPFIEAWSGGNNMFNSEAAEARAQGKFNSEQRVDLRDFLRQEVGSFLNDPSDANIAASRARSLAAGIDAADFDAYVAPYTALPVEQRAARLQNELATSADGLKLLERFTPEWKREDRGGSIATVNMNPLAPGATPPATAATTADPRAPQILPTAGGLYSATPGGGPAMPVTDAAGNILQPYDSSPPAAAGGPQDAKANAAEGLRSTLESLRGYYSALDQSGGIVSTERGGGENLVASAGASLPGRVLGRTFGSRDQTQRDNIQTAIPMIVASLKDLTGMSAQQMNSNVELQLFLNTVSAPDQSIETVTEALNRFERYVDRVAGAGGGAGAPAGGGDSRAALEAEARRRGLIQ